MKHRHVWISGMTALATCACAFAAKPANDYGKLPLTFEVNAGQTEGRVKYLSRGAGYTLFLTSDNEAILSLARTSSAGERQTAAVRMTMPGSQHASAIRALEPSSTVSNYLYGKDAKRWLTGVPHFGRISYEGIYPGIDVVYYGNQRQLEYDFIVAPGSDPRIIRLKFEGADRISTQNGDLVLHTRYGPLRQLKPVVYQEINGERRYVTANYAVAGGKEASFSIGEYDHSKKLIIDPVLVYSTFLGGTGVEYGNAVAVDSTGSAYVVGSTTSTDLVIVGGLAGQLTYRGETDAFLVKYSPAGNTIEFSTYIGGTGSDEATAVGVDNTGAILVGGNTRSNNFPLRNAIQAQIGNTSGNTVVYDAFVLKIDTNGLVYSTYLGGFDDDRLTGLAVDTNRNVVLCGVTKSTNFWASGGPLTAFQGRVTDGWTLKLDPAGLHVWSTYLGGNREDVAAAVAVDPQGNAYVTGGTFSTNFPLANPTQAALARVNFSDAFVTKIKNDGTAFLYSTYLGGTENDRGQSIAVNAQGNAYIAGYTESTNFPTRNPLQGPPGNGDGFVAKMNTSGTDTVFATYLAGSGLDTPTGIAVDAAGDAYVLGTTDSTNFPVGSPIQATLLGGTDLFVTKINSAGTARVWSSYLGGTLNDIGTGIAVDTASNVYLTGYTISAADFPHFLGPQLVLYGAQDAFLTKIAGCDVLISPAAATFDVNAGSGSFTVNATACPWNASASDPWITITSLAAGSGSAAITYTITANPGVARSGFISVSGVRYNITQEGSVSGNSPSVTGLTPNTGSGSVQTFTAKYATANPGGATVDHTYLMVNTSINGIGSCMAEYTPSTNAFRLINSDGSAWSAPAIAGTGVILSNSQCSLNVAASSGSNAAGVGITETTVLYALTFETSFSGPKNVYLLALNDAGPNSGWIQGGSWTVNSSINPSGTPGVFSLTPTTGAGALGNTFTGVFTHTGGATQHYLGYMLFLPTPNVVNYTATGTCLVEYNRISNGMRLIDNLGTGWLGPITGIPLATPGASLTNNYCSVNVQAATAIVNGTNMTVNVPVTFSNTLGPVLGTFLQALDVNGVWTGMTQFGNWVLPGAPPVRSGPTISSILPTNAASSAVIYTLTASHLGGASALAQVHMLISDRIVGGTPCQVIYFPGSNTLNLINDSGTALVSPAGVAPGTAVNLSNSRCSINAGAASATAVGTSMSVTLPMIFSPVTFGGSKNVYGNAFDNGGLTSHWVQGATLLVQ